MTVFPRPNEPDLANHSKENEALPSSRRGKPLRILYPVSEGFDFRRARFHQILQTTHALARQNCEVELLIGKNRINVLQEAFPYFHLHRHEYLRIHEIPMFRMEEDRPLRLSWGGLYLINVLIKIRGLLRDRAYHAIYLRHLKLANFLLTWKRVLKIPIIFEAHELFHLTAEENKKTSKLRKQEERLYSRIDGVVSITEGLAEKIRSVFQVSPPLAVIPDGVNFDFYKRETPYVPNTTILYVGQLYSWKGVGTLIKAMSHLPKGKLDVVGGSREGVEKWRRAAAALNLSDRVAFHGQVAPQAVRSYMQKAGVAVLPLTQDMISASFTSPLKLFEYMAAGLPVVASDLPSLREVLVPDENALLVPPDDPPALAAGIRRVLENPHLAGRLSRKAFADAQEFTWAKRAEKIRQFLQSLET